MKVAIMQPYFFPYIGYFQLINAVDKFVIYDDVNYINRSWINRNYILSQNNKLLLSLELEKASQNKLINEINIGGNRPKIVKTIQQSYAKAESFSQIISLINDCLLDCENNLSLYLSNSLQKVSEYLGIETEWYLSSRLNKDTSLKGEDKIISICKELEASEYINLPGGQHLYEHKNFNKHNIKLSFIKPELSNYQQIDESFTPMLSIIDVLMFNSQINCKKMIKEYQIV
jgi:hypothetical protein